MTESRKFNNGDVVKLNSGGPKMTVSGYGDDGRVVCVWFEKSKQFNGAFSEEVLKKFEEGLGVTLRRM